MLAGAIARELTNKKISAAKVSIKKLQAAFSVLDKRKVIVAFVEGWHLGTYQFDTYKKKKAEERTNLLFQDGLDPKSVEIGKKRAEAVAFSRDLMNEVPSRLNPETFPKKLQEAFTSTDVDVVV